MTTQPSLFDDDPPDDALVPDAPPKLPWRKGAYAVPRGRAHTHCRSCGADIVWISTPAGGRMPLSVATIRKETDGTRTALSHFVDCKQAKAWSKQGEKKQ